MAKILIIEDDPDIRRYLEIELTYAGYQIEFANDGNEGLEKSKNEDLDIILLDLMLPKISGERLCKMIREFSQVPIIILSAKDEVLTKVKLLDIGANDYITKPFEIEELLVRVRVALRNVSSHAKKDYLKHGNIKIDLVKKNVYFKEKLLDLTKTEFLIIHYLVINKNIVLSREQIIIDVWGYDYMGNDKIVDAYIKNLRKKIDDGSIQTIRGFGYLLGKEEK